VVSINKTKSFIRGAKGLTRKLRVGKTGFKIQCMNGDTYYAKHCVCALPKQAILKMHCALFRKAIPYLQHIKCGSLCRIYCKFTKYADKDKENSENGSDTKVWFHDLGKITTDNDLRMIIPIDIEKGIVMISYSDNRWADEWNRLHLSEGIHAVNQKLHELVKSLMGPSQSIPIPTNTHVFYWKCGVGYWGKGVDSRVAENRIRQPTAGLYVCGEHYSSHSQQWMEGALDTATQVIRDIQSRKTRHNI
jgi:monoamine oxidase